MYSCFMSFRFYAIAFLAQAAFKNSQYSRLLLAFKRSLVKKIKSPKIPKTHEARVYLNKDKHSPTKAIYNRIALPEPRVSL